MRSAPLVLTLSLLAFGPCSAAPAEIDGAPYETMRTLQALQDRIATGDTVAQAAHAKAILKTGRGFIAAKPETWRDKRNARALVIYLFSGGYAAAIGNAIPAEAMPVELQPLYEGALAYGLSDDQTARAKLMEIDARTLPTGLGGHLALVQAMLIAASDQTKAIALLDDARLLEPGTLIEEAALRKEISLIGATGDLDKFALLTRRYLTGFPKSTYGGNFRQLVAHVAMQLGDGDSDISIDKLGRLMHALDLVEQRRLYLDIARDALISGRTTMAALAATEARRLSRSGDNNEARAMVYFGAATIVGSKYEQGIKALNDAMPSLLEGKDRALRTSALALADLIRKAPAESRSHQEFSPAHNAIVADAERSIAAADTILQDKTKWP